MDRKQPSEKQSAFPGSAYALVAILLVLSSMAAYMLHRLYQTSSALAESNKRTFAFEIKNKRSILQEYFAERIYDLERFVANPAFQNYFQSKELAPSNEQAMKIVTGQLEQALLVKRLRMEKQGKPVYSRIAFYDLEEQEVAARTDFSPKGRWINDELFDRIKGTVSESLNLISICPHGECRILMAAYITFRGRPGGILLMELTTSVIRDQIQLLSLQKLNNFTGLIDGSGRLILGPERFVGEKTQDLFGLSPIQLGEMQEMASSARLWKMDGEKLVVAGARLPGINFFLVQVDKQSRFIGSHSPALWTLVFISLMIALALVLGHIFRSYAERQVMYRQLREAHDNLELRVEERTAELVEVNNRLSLEVQDRRRAEDALREASEELRSANRDLKDFAYVVSHDLKAPLRSVRQILDWIREDYGDLFDETGKEYLGLLTQRVKMMHNLIEGILKYSRVGRLEGQEESVDLHDMVNNIVEMISPSDNVKIKIENQLPRIKGEPTQLHEIFQNLIDNAVKYMDKPQGVINIGYEYKEGFWIFKVQDNGPGIPEADFENVFKIFKTLSDKEDENSSGIGLALVKKMVERRGGRIWVESQPGVGATFLFTLPHRSSKLEKYDTYSAQHETQSPMA